MNQQRYVQKWKCLHEQCKFETDDPVEAATHVWAKEKEGHAIVEV